MEKRMSLLWRTRVDRSIISQTTFVAELFQFGPEEDNVLLSVAFSSPWEQSKPSLSSRETSNVHRHLDWIGDGSAYNLPV